jgi:glycosyltransferase involved in cell wall biosynthesis
MRQKGLHTLAEVARRLSGVARFHIAGYAETGSPDAVPVEQVDDWAKEGHVVWLGSRDDMPELMASANIVVLPSFREGVPKVLIEAAASGRPIVTSDVPGCREVCQDGINGLLTAPGDPDALERAIRRLIVDADLRRRMGAAGRRIAEEEFALDRVIEETLRLYERMLPSTRT